MLARNQSVREPLELRFSPGTAAMEDAEVVTKVRPLCTGSHAQTGKLLVSEGDLVLL